jgi:hypothetical protein
MPVKNFLRPNEVQECEEDLRNCDALLERRKYDKRAQHSSIATSRKAIQKRLEQAPPDLTPEQRTKASARVKELEEQIKVGMLSHEEMRRNPPGAVAQNLRWGRKNAKNVHEWKNFQLALMKGASQTDVAEALNVARLRPRPSQLNMDGAQIDGKTFVRGFGDAIDWSKNTSSESEPVFADEDPTDEE